MLWRMLIPDDMKSCGTGIESGQYCTTEIEAEKGAVFKGKLDSTCDTYLLVKCPSPLQGHSFL